MVWDFLLVLLHILRLDDHTPSRNQKKFHNVCVIKGIYENFFYILKC